MNSLTEKTLAEHLRITDVGIMDRKALLRFTDADARALGGFRATISGLVDAVVEEFYAHQVTIPEIAAIIGDRETLGRLCTAMRDYVLRLFDGSYDADYVNARLRIGKVHARIGVSPKLYVSSLHSLETITRDHARRAGATPVLLDALRKLFMFDLQLVFDTYILGLVSEVELARDQVAAYAGILEEKVAARTAEISLMARTDELTGLWNRREFFDRLRRETERAVHQRTNLALVFLDINDFKLYNDGLGHIAGDRIIADVGAALKASIRETDFAFRYGGDEFCLLLPGADEDDAHERCEGLMAALPEQITLSYGVALYALSDGRDLDAFIGRADRAMYAAKATYRGRKGGAGRKQA